MLVALYLCCWLEAFTHDALGAAGGGGANGDDTSDVKRESCALLRRAVSSPQPTRQPKCGIAEELMPMAGTDSEYE